MVVVNTCLLFPVKENKSGSSVQVSFADRGGHSTVKNAAYLPKGREEGNFFFPEKSSIPILATQAKSSIRGDVMRCTSLSFATQRLLSEAKNSTEQLRVG